MLVDFCDSACTDTHTSSYKLKVFTRPPENARKYETKTNASFVVSCTNKLWVPQ